MSGPGQDRADVRQELVDHGPAPARHGKGGGPRSAAAARRRRRAIQVVSLAAGAGLWELYGQVWGSNLTIPPLSSILAAAPDVLSSGEYWSALGTTMLALVLGLLIVLGAGYAIGALSGVNRTVGRILQPYMVIGLAAPMIAVIPIIQLLFGLGLAARLGVVVVFALPYFVVNVAAGYREPPQDLLDMCRTFGVSRTQTFLKVRTFAAMPAMLAGARLAVARAFVGVVVAELLVLATGVGRLIARESQTFHLEDMYVVVLTVLLLASLLLGLVGIGERRMLQRIGGGR